MAPPMKELPRWLLENPEFSIAPDWTDIVKQSVSSKDCHSDVATFSLHTQPSHIASLDFLVNFSNPKSSYTGFPSRSHVRPPSDRPCSQGGRCPSPGATAQI